MRCPGTSSPIPYAPNTSPVIQKNLPSRSTAYSSAPALFHSIYSVHRSLFSQLARSPVGLLGLSYCRAVSSARLDCGLLFPARSTATTA